MTPGPGGQFDHLLKNMKSRVHSQESRRETEESRVNIPESEDKKIGDVKVESRVEGDKSIVKSLEPVVESQESRRETEESRDKQAEFERVDSRDNSRESIVESLESRAEGLDTKALEEAIEEAITKPKLGIYSPLAAAMLRYRAITTPRYSMGSEMKTIIEKALKETYPELYEEVQKRMSEG